MQQLIRERERQVVTSFRIFSRSTLYEGRPGPAAAAGPAARSSGSSALDEACSWCSRMARASFRRSSCSSCWMDMAAYLPSGASSTTLLTPTLPSSRSYIGRTFATAGARFSKPPAAPAPPAPSPPASRAKFTKRTMRLPTVASRRLSLSRFRPAPFTSAPTSRPSVSATYTLCRRMAASWSTSATSRPWRSSPCSGTVAVPTCSIVRASHTSICRCRSSRYSNSRRRSSRDGAAPRAGLPNLCTRPRASPAPRAPAPSRSGPAAPGCASRSLSPRSTSFAVEGLTSDPAQVFSPGNS